MIALLAGCSLLSFQNDPPKLDAVNGIEYHALLGGFPAMDLAFVAAPETDFQITVLFHDSEHDDVQIWWPRSPEGWDFDPDATTGTWHVPADPLPVWGLTMLLADDHRNDAKTAEFFVPITVLGGDTAYYAY